jgi:hypothetical protein
MQTLDEYLSSRWSMSRETYYGLCQPVRNALLREYARQANAEVNEPGVPLVNEQGVPLVMAARMVDTAYEKEAREQADRLCQRLFPPTMDAGQVRLRAERMGLVEERRCKDTLRFTDTHPVRPLTFAEVRRMERRFLVGWVATVLVAGILVAAVTALMYAGFGR